MARQEIKREIHICDRCDFTRPNEATQERIYALDDRYYRIDVCDDHAAMFDRDLGKWTMLSEEVEGPSRNFRSRFWTEERKNDDRRIAELRDAAERKARAELAARERLAEIERAEQERVRRLIPGALGWRLTEHAWQRMAEREFGLEEVLWTVTRPEHTSPGREVGLTIYQRGACRVVANPNTKGIITVMDRLRVEQRQAAQ